MVMKLTKYTEEYLEAKQRAKLCLESIKIRNASYEPQTFDCTLERWAEDLLEHRCHRSPLNEN